MTKNCANCGASITPDARFCRRCGTPLRGGVDDGSDIISPHAATVPLPGEGRVTNDFAPDDPAPAGPNTSRVNRAEIERLLNSTPTGPTADPAPGVALDGQGQTFHAPSPDSYSTPDDTGPQTSELSPRRVTGTDDLAQADSLFDGSDEEELTIISSAKSVRPASERIIDGPAALPVQDPPAVHESTPVAPPQTAPAGAPPSTRPRRVGPLTLVIVGGVVVCAVVAVASWLAFDYFRRPVTTERVDVPPSSTGDVRQLIDEKIAEARTLLASGDIDGAIARVREAVALDQLNVAARRELGDLLLRSGRRREAIEEYRAITRSDPNDASAWRSLASAQLEERIYADAVKSYRRLFELTGETGQSPADLLGFADALRLSGSADEARAVYERLISYPTEEARLAQQRLAEMIPSLPTPMPSDESHADASHANAAAPSTTPAVQAPTPVLAPTPVPTPPPPAAELSAGEYFARGERLWQSNRAAAVAEFQKAAGKGNADAYYYLGLSIVDGKDPRALNRAELLRALQLFQNVRGGRFSGQAHRYEEQLGKEYDRRRNQ